MALDHLDAVRGRIGVGGIDGDRRGGRYALGVEACVVDDDQSARAVRHVGHAAGDFHVPRCGGEHVARLNPARVVWVGEIDDVEPVLHNKASAAW